MSNLKHYATVWQLELLTNNETNILMYKDSYVQGLSSRILDDILFILLLKRKVKSKKKSRKIFKKLSKHFLSCNIFISFFEKSHTSGPVHLKMTLVLP